MQQLERIAHMETLLNQSADAVRQLEEALCTYRRVIPALRELEAYYTSPLWRADYEDDCAGKLPPDIKRGVLSEDAVYALLEARDEALHAMQALCTDGKAPIDASED